MLQRIAEGTRALCRSDSAAIFLREGDTLLPRYRVGPWPEIYRTLRIRPGESIGGEVMLTGKPTRSDDYASDPRVPASHRVIAQQTGTKVVELPVMVGGVPEAKDYISFIDYNLKTMLKAVQGG